MMNTISILGSTGSIGRQTLDVAEQLGLQVAALTANSNVERMEAQCRKFRPRLAVMTEEAAAKELAVRLQDTSVKVLAGTDALVDAAVIPEAETVVTAVVGMVGLKATLAAIREKKRIALANKETLVCAGELVMSEADRCGAEIVPVDSEHSAIFQSLQGAPENSLKKILLTASGGPFYGRKRKDLENVTVKDALNHPNWSMGAKITVDSASLMNKGLEVIEAVHLFGVTADEIEVLVHRQSILHSAVELCDGAVIAQLGTPDMRLPIQYALTYPDRADNAFEHLSLTDIGTLTFEKPDTETFKCLPICIEAINEGGLAPTAVNGANEEAVALFLQGKIKFLQIADLVEKALAEVKNKRDYTVEDIFETDKAARKLVRESIF